ncbi:helix-turn-helix transcriptional regulator [Microbacterium suaedae]|uniref:helix-turn-helix transcriptional regulator n=1 Tax=Microbacterium suaedae TaxID=2067813 RepID=UPI0013A5FE96|nr:helix-turn-helix transcriptional regulator [Microbacterium suaedae]
MSLPRRHGPIGAVTEDGEASREQQSDAWIRVVFVRRGNAKISWAHGSRTVYSGDVALIGPRASATISDRAEATTTTLFLDWQYAVDQVYWQSFGFVEDRIEAAKILNRAYAPGVLFAQLHASQREVIEPRIDRIAELCAAPLTRTCNYLINAHFHEVMSVLVTSLPPVLAPPGDPEEILPFDAPTAVLEPHGTRPEARLASALLRNAPSRRWTLDELAAAVSLSTSQLCRVFADTYGQTPRAYLADTRLTLLADILRDTEMPVTAAIRHVGWTNRGHASRRFRDRFGLTPSDYREAMSRRTAPPETEPHGSRSDSARSRTRAR